MTREDWRAIRIKINMWSLECNQFSSDNAKSPYIKRLCLEAEMQQAKESREDYLDSYSEERIQSIAKWSKRKQIGDKLIRYGLMSYFLLEIVKIIWIGG